MHSVGEMHGKPGRKAPMEGMDGQAWINGFRENAVVWMIVFFVGILYWAFRPRFQRRKPKADPKAGARK